VVHRFLRHPHLRLGAVPVWVPVLVLAVAVAAACAWLGLRVRRARTRADAARRASWVVIQPPPGPAGAAQAEAFWLKMAGLLGKRRRGWLPHVVFELAWVRGGLVIAVWVPGVIEPGMVEWIIGAAWPGAVTHVTDAPAWSVTGQGEVAGGQLSPAGGRDWMPFHSASYPADPLSGVLETGLFTAAGDVVAVQVLVRPASLTRVARARAGAGGKPGVALGAGGKTVHGARLLGRGLLDTLLELITTGSAHSGLPRQSGGPAKDPFEEMLRQAARRKMGTPPHFEVAVRFLASIAPHDAAEGRQVSGARQFCDLLSYGYAALSGGMDLRGSRLSRPVRAIGERRLARGFLTTNGELAQLAHLPWEPGTVPGLRTAGARPVPPPHGTVWVRDPWPR
jgi:hypothetical protein